MFFFYIHILMILFSAISWLLFSLFISLAYYTDDYDSKAIIVSVTFGLGLFCNFTCTGLILYSSYRVYQIS
jgi:uncharacterized membrane protein YedE/YeeE